MTFSRSCRAPGCVSAVPEASEETCLQGGTTVRKCSHQKEPKTTERGSGEERLCVSPEELNTQFQKVLLTGSVSDVSGTFNFPKSVMPTFHKCHCHFNNTEMFTLCHHLLCLELPWAVHIQGAWGPRWVPLHQTPA